MPQANLTLDDRFTIGPVDRRLFGGFLEHMGRGIYDGIYEPDHPTADEDGFRKDVIELVRELGVSTVRYPGGNFVSGFKWEDSVGPRESRPRRLNLAWHALETNEVGLHEFSRWLDKVGSELMLAVNLGTRGVQEALDLLEYANIPGGTTLSEQRIANGAARPFDVKMWCLGNEMDGPWQLGHRTAEEYGRIASITAKAMRQVDPSLQLVACGSSNRQMPTFGSWERTVLYHTYHDVDFISCHAYWDERKHGLETFLASGEDMDQMIDSVVATADHVKAALKSDHTVNVSFDEWNVWDVKRFQEEERVSGIGNWPKAPRVGEDSYTVADAVVVGSLLISLINHADRVTSASIAQLVNAIAPITTEPGGGVFRQTTFFPFSLTSKLASGSALRCNIETEMYDTAAYGRAKLIDAAATRGENGTAVFIVNRSTTDVSTVTIDARALGNLSVQEATSMFDEDVHARNSLTNPDRVQPRANQSVREVDGKIVLDLPAVSWTALKLG